MRLPEFVTITGLDENTDLGRVLDLSARYPIEWAVLFSWNKQGMSPRYPSHEVRRKIVQALESARLSAHFCGYAYAGAALNGTGDPEFYKDELKGFSRVQLNSRYYPGYLAESLMFYQRVGVKPIIQWRFSEFHELKGVIDLLYDCSGGRGVLPKGQWPRHTSGTLVGFAGGLGPDNVKDQIRLIDAQGPYWIDMESNVRTEDWLDLDKVESVLSQIYD
jgi:phosphoribosylanthranilate isomerase